MSLLDKVEVTRRMCPVIFLLDSSGSMNGAPIGAVDSAIEGVLPVLASMNDENPDAEIRVAIMEFSSTAEWITKEGLVSPNNYTWPTGQLSAEGPTQMGAAFKELNKKLSVKSGFMQRASGSVAPVLFLLSDGAPTDDYQSGLKALKENNWYKCAAKVAIGYSDQCDDEVLAEFTGNKETVLHTNDPNELKKMIRFVTITSSQVASSGKGGSAITTDGVQESMEDNTAKLAEELQGGAIENADPDEEF